LSSSFCLFRWPAQLGGQLNWVASSIGWPAQLGGQLNCGLRYRYFGYFEPAEETSRDKAASY
jgi:hypothetical protein